MPAPKSFSNCFFKALALRNVAWSRPSSLSSYTSIKVRSFHLKNAIHFQESQASLYLHDSNDLCELPCPLAHSEAATTSQPLLDRESHLYEMSWQSMGKLNLIKRVWHSIKLGSRQGIPILLITHLLKPLTCGMMRSSRQEGTLNSIETWCSVSISMIAPGLCYSNL